MKTIISCVVCIVFTALTVFCLMAYSSEKDPKKQIAEQVAEADRGLSPPYVEGGGPLVSIVWYKGPLRAPYKIFSDYRDIENIRYRLSYKGLQSNIDRRSEFGNSEDRLAFVSYSDRANTYRMRYVPFRIENNIFYWPYGEDKKIAQILIEKESWGSSFDYIDPTDLIQFDNLTKRQKRVEEKLGLQEQTKKISQIRDYLATKDTPSPEERSLLETSKAALSNLLEIKGYACNIEDINDMLLELNENELRESIVHAFVQLPESRKENYGQFISPEADEKIRRFSEKYEEEGLSREEQKELLQIHQEINKKILDELQRRQNDFMSILQTIKPQEVYD